MVLENEEKNHLLEEENNLVRIWGDRGVKSHKKNCGLFYEYLFGFGINLTFKEFNSNTFTYLYIAWCNYFKNNSVPFQKFADVCLPSLMPNRDGLP